MVKLTYTTIANGNIYPVVFNYLHNMPEAALHHTKHSLRHPLAIYNKSIGRTINAFIAVLDEVETLHMTSLKSDGNINFDLAPLLKAQKELLAVCRREQSRTHVMCEMSTPVLAVHNTNTLYASS